MCYYLYPPCGNTTHFVPPTALCEDICSYLTTELCQAEWQQILLYLEGVGDILSHYNVKFLNCSDPGAPLGDLPHCCSNAGVTIPQPSEDVHKHMCMHAFFQGLAIICTGLQLLKVYECTSLYGFVYNSNGKFRRVSDTHRNAATHHFSGCNCCLSFGHSGCALGCGCGHSCGSAVFGDKEGQKEDCTPVW